MLVCVCCVVTVCVCAVGDARAALLRCCGGGWEVHARCFLFVYLTVVVECGDRAVGALFGRRIVRA